MAAVTVEVVRVDALGPAERDAWAAFVAADARLAGPFHTLEFARVAAAISPRSGVAVVRRGGVVVAFLPFQNRGRALHPLGAPLTDYHGLIAAPDAALDMGQVLRRMNAARFATTAWTGAAPFPGALARRRMVADLGDGFEGWRKGRASLVKDKLRRGRGLARDHGEPTMQLDDPDPAALDWLLENKRRQYAATGQHDVFACRWTETLLRTLHQQRGSTFGGAVATLRLRDRIVAAEYVLGAGDVRHLWFPVYDRAYARYSPGSLLLVEQMRRWADAGVRTVDFGPDVEGYKAEFADPADAVYEGVMLAAGRQPLMAAGEFARLQRKAERRLRVIRACEPDRVSAAGALLDNVVAMLRRRLEQTGGGVSGATAALPMPPL
jgi:CelD/BcsL family acetyltransferase involved in cellulose biosynthesis